MLCKKTFYFFLFHQLVRAHWTRPFLKRKKAKKHPEQNYSQRIYVVFFLVNVLYLHSFLETADYLWGLVFFCAKKRHFSLHVVKINDYNIFWVINEDIFRLEISVYYVAVVDSLQTTSYLAKEHRYFFLCFVLLSEKSAKIPISELFCFYCIIVVYKQKLCGRFWIVYLLHVILVDWV